MSQVPALVLERFRARLAVEQSKNTPRAEELRAILIGMLGGPLSEDQRQRMVEILRRTQPVALEEREVAFDCVDDSVKGRFKALAVANREAEHPSVYTLVLCLGHGLSDVRLT